jgi:hypothetical protein
MAAIPTIPAAPRIMRVALGHVFPSPFNESDRFVKNLDRNDSHEK